MYTINEQNILMDQARHTIEYGLENLSEYHFNTATESKNLLNIAASFVTLYHDSKLRGCIGTLEAHKPLLKDISDNAYSAAFHDPRFSRLTHIEYRDISIELSILTQPEAIVFTTEDHLLSLIRVGIDGIIFEDNQYRATYLPSVWQYFETAQSFLNSLKEKSGLPADHWANSVKIYRYTTQLVT